MDNEATKYRLVVAPGTETVRAQFDCPHCNHAQACTRGTQGNYCCPWCQGYLRFRLPAPLVQAMELADEQPEPEPAGAEEEELGGEDAEETIILETPDILQTMAMAAGERKADYRPFSPSWGVFELLSTMLQLAVGTAVEAASIVAAERDHNVD